MADKKGGWLEKLKDGKGNPWLIGLLIGLVLLVAAIPTEENTEESGTADEKAVQMQGDEDFNAEDKIQSLEKRLAKILEQVEGVGEVEVMITLRSSGEQIVEKDSKSQHSESEQDQSEQGKSKSSLTEQEEATVYLKGSDGEEYPYVKEVMEPQIEGVVVAAEGGGNPTVNADITEAVVALFHVEAHKIKVMKKKS